MFVSDAEIDCADSQSNLDIIDRLDGVEDGYVKLLLSTGVVVYGMPLGIIYNEDNNGWDTIKRIVVKPYHSPHSQDYGLEDILSFELIDEYDIPNAEKKPQILSDKEINSKVQVKYIGPDDPLSLHTNKIYEARVLKKGWFGIVDETNEEYAYPPELFEVIDCPITL